MREILFRGFHKAENGTETIYLNGEKIKGNWVYGDLAHSIYLRDDKCFISTYQDYIPKDLDATMFEVIPETVGQYTDLDDKNGKKIFENDVIKYENEEVSYVVMFDPTGYWCLDGNGARNSEMLIQLDDTNKYIEVLKTIFDKEVK